MAGYLGPRSLIGSAGFEFILTLQFSISFTIGISANASPEVEVISITDDLDILGDNEGDKEGKIDEKDEEA